jgi:hypothetical protein
MRVKLRAKGKKIPVPTPPAILQSAKGGDPTPVPSHGGTVPSTRGTVSFGPRPITIGVYTPPPKNPIWTQIPTSIKPTLLPGVKACKGCG